MGGHVHIRLQYSTDVFNAGWNGRAAAECEAEPVSCRCEVAREDAAARKVSWPVDTAIPAEIAIDLSGSLLGAQTRVVTPPYVT
jgi:hypothetical protein